MTAYTDRLDALWAAHRARRDALAPTVVSTFAGAGGSGLGWSAAGFRELLAVEWDAHAVACLRRNFPGLLIHHGDIAALDPASLDLPTGELDVLDGSPPCQGFSTSGERRLDDPRNQLFREFLRLLEAWQPRAFVMENVSGMVKGKMRPLFAEILACLKRAAPGYRVVARLMDASYLGVAQSRKRMIFIGVREDLGLDPVHPAPFTRPQTVRQALADLGDPGLILTPQGKAAAISHLVPPGGDGVDALATRGGKHSWFSLQRAHWDRPSFTVIKSLRTSQNGLLHPTENRFMSSREITRLQTFPDQYDWGDSGLVDIWARVGNSVPPLVMQAIATAVREHVLDRARPAPAP